LWLGAAPFQQSSASFVRGQVSGLVAFFDSPDDLERIGLPKGTVDHLAQKELLKAGAIGAWVPPLSKAIERVRRIMQSTDYRVEKDEAAGRGEGELWTSQEQLRSAQAELGWLRGEQTGILATGNARGKRAEQLGDRLEDAELARAMAMSLGAGGGAPATESDTEDAEQRAQQEQQAEQARQAQARRQEELKRQARRAEEEIDENYEPTEAEIVEYAKWLGMDLEADKELFWVAREGLKAPLPPDWKPCKSPDGEIYYLNFSNGER